MLKFACRYILKILPLFIIFIISCEKSDTNSLPPSANFITGSGYTSSDTILPAGGRITVGINATSENANITFFQVSYNNGTKHILLDSGLNKPVLHYELSIIKSATPFEKWTFLVMDRNRHKDSIQLMITKSENSSYGDIITMENITLGAQAGSTGSFLSFGNGQVYTLDEAFADQKAINMIYYYDQYEGTLSSPNESEAPAIFTGPGGIANWTIKNETRYDTTSIATSDFDKAVNDSLILSTYDAASAKRKCKYIQSGMVISFVTDNGKIGLLRISNVEAGTAGKMDFSVKIQK